jgi:glutathione S-transferase
MLALYFSPGSSAMAPHIALHEIGCPFEPRPVSFGNSEQKTPEYLAVNAAGKVPTLLVDGRPLTEVAGILYYLAKTYPEAGLWPAGGAETEARVVEWMSFIASTIHPARRAGPDASRAAFAIAEARLAGRDWAVGEAYSIADIHLFRLYWRFVTSLHPGPGEFPALHRHFERIMARPAVKKTIAIESALGYQLPR